MVGGDDIFERRCTHVAAGLVKFLRQLFERIFLSCQKCNSISFLGERAPGTETLVSMLIRGSLEATPGLIGGTENAK